VKITVALPSRNRPVRLADTIGSLHSRASGKHEITYVVGCDDDDPTTAELVAMISARGLPVKAHCGPRPQSLGGLVNEICAVNPADVYCSLCDDVMAYTPDWDEAIHTSWLKRRDGVWWWKTKESYYAIVSDKWYRAAGRIFTDYFPFWWDDCWLSRLWIYVTDKPLLRIDAWLEDGAPATTRMRDLQFWTEFYWSREDERRQEAIRIRRALGRNPALKSKPRMNVSRSAHYEQNIEKIEAQQGEKRPPTPEYLRALARAKAMMTPERKAA
jgi:glycosyltransferase involved in cell wall biosynthesis